MNKIIIEVGSTVTKVDQYDGTSVKRIKDITIFFKKNYQEEKRINKDDYEKLVNLVNELKQDNKDIYICGTSIFRNLKPEEKEEFLNNFKEQTAYDFHIISQDEESELTVLGTTRNVKEKVCVFIGGGGSTEIAIYDNEITENVNTPMGVIDILSVFKDLANDTATTSLEEVMDYIKERINLPKEKADILILAGGGHEKFARESGIKYEENTLFQDLTSPIMMDIETRIAETKRYFESISLDNIRAKSDDPAWWDATRAMCAFVLVVASSIEAKYIIPTNIGMVYGIIKNEE